MIALVVVAMMTMALSAVAFGQTVGEATTGTGSITINNAAKGETYSVIKLFDATVGKNNEIAYTGTIPDSLKNYFVKDTAGNISKKAGVDDEDLIKAVQAWAATQNVTGTESDGSALTFQGLAYGYYAVKSSQGTVITIDSTNPTASIYDKNSTEPKNLKKDVDNDNVNIGDTLTYTVTYETSNFTGVGKDAKKIVSYTIEDTLPGFLSDVTVTSIIVDNDGDLQTTNDQTNVTKQFTDKKITLDWVNATTKDSLYTNGAKVVITYTATLNDTAAIDGAGNTNVVKLTWKDEDGNDTPEGKELKDEETVFTYAIALKKVNEEGAPLAGATFEFPFYVKATPDTDGAYIYAGTAEGDGLVKTITTPADGSIVVKGLASGNAIAVTETEAPAGYNKLTSSVTVTPTKTSATTTNTTIKLDADGNVVETNETVTVAYTNDNIAATVIAVLNKTGGTLPSTGGMGTTILYIVGAVLVIGAVVLLITRRRLNAEK